jgi:transposase
LVTEEHREALVQRIAEAYQRGIAWKIREILELIQEKSHESVDKNSLYHWLQPETRIRAC